MYTMASFFSLLSGFFIFLLLTPLAFADPLLDLQITPLVPEVEAGEEATFQIMITNNAEERDVFKITADPLSESPSSTSVQFITIQPNQLKLEPHESEPVFVTLKTLTSASTDKVGTATIHVASLINTNTKETATIDFFIVPERDAVHILLPLPETVTPGEETRFTVVFKNRLSTPLTDYTVSFASTLPGFSDSTILSFAPRETKEHTFHLTVPATVTPGDYELNIRVYDGETLKGSFTSALTISGKPVVEDERKDETGFLLRTITLTKKNIGNARASQRIEMESSFIKNIFTSATPEPSERNGNLVWTFELEPQEAFTVTVVRNYRSLFYGFLVIVLVTILIFFYIDRSVVIKKRIFKVKAAHDGISELKILLIIRNGKRAAIENVQAVDLLPTLIEPTYDFGTLKPTRIQTGLKGKRILWELGTLEKGEERVLTYKVNAKLHLAGEIVLPPAALHYMWKGNALTAASDKLNISP